MSGVGGNQWLAVRSPQAVLGYRTAPPTRLPPVASAPAQSGSSRPAQSMFGSTWAGPFVDGEGAANARAASTNGSSGRGSGEGFHARPNLSNTLPAGSTLPKVSQPDSLDAFLGNGTPSGRQQLMVGANDGMMTNSQTGFRNDDSRPGNSSGPRQLGLPGTRHMAWSQMAAHSGTASALAFSDLNGGNSPTRSGRGGNSPTRSSLQRSPQAASSNALLGNSRRTNGLGGSDTLNHSASNPARPDNDLEKLAAGDRWFQTSITTGGLHQVSGGAQQLAAPTSWPVMPPAGANMPGPQDRPAAPAGSLVVVPGAGRQRKLAAATSSSRDIGRDIVARENAVAASGFNSAGPSLPQVSTSSSSSKVTRKTSETEALTWPEVVKPEALANSKQPEVSADGRPLTRGGERQAGGTRETPASSNEVFQTVPVAKARRAQTDKDRATLS